MQPERSYSPAPNSSGTLLLRSRGFAYAGRPVLAPYALNIGPSETVAILGPSGCGKSTLLKQVAGLLPGLEQDAPHCAWMAQQDLLLPWLSVRENVLLGARLRGEAAGYAQADTLLDRLGLGAWRDVFPAALSGGMRQRAALARTLAEDRSLVLMDEPFSALDPITRERMQDLACDLLADRAILLVTHDPAEACRIADRIYVLAGQPAKLELATALPLPKPRDPLSVTLLPYLRDLQDMLRRNGAAG